MSMENEIEIQEQTEAANNAQNSNFGWYVVHTYSGYEKKVRDSIESMVRNNSSKGLLKRVFIPTTIENVTDKKGQTKEQEKISFPGYILVEMECTKDSWYWVRNIRGVTGFVGADPLNPLPLSNEEVAKIGIDVDESVVKEFVSKFRIDQMITVVSGPLAGNVGRVADIIRPEEGKKGYIKAIVSLFGKDVSAELDYTDVEPMD